MSRDAAPPIRPTQPYTTNMAAQRGEGQSEHSDDVGSSAVRTDVSRCSLCCGALCFKPARRTRSAVPETTPPELPERVPVLGDSPGNRHSNHRKHLRKHKWRARHRSEGLEHCMVRFTLAHYSHVYDYENIDQADEAQWRLRSWFYPPVDRAGQRTVCLGSAFAICLCLSHKLSHIAPHPFCLSVCLSVCLSPPLSLSLSLSLSLFLTGRAVVA